MPTVTVLEKLYGSGSPEAFMRRYSEMLSGLEVELQLAGTTERGWIQLELTGEDETAAVNLLEREVGLAPATLERLQKFSVIRGRGVFSSRKGDELFVDIGVFSPKICDAKISADSLRAQLADGKQLSLNELIELYSLYDNMPLEVRIIQSNLGDDSGGVEAELSDRQIRLFSRWIRAHLDRLLVFGAFLKDVEQAAKFSGHARDVVRVESLGALEQAVICKLGTDAAGLIPKLGRYLESAVLVPFSPARIIEIVGCGVSV